MRYLCGLGVPNYVISKWPLSTQLVIRNSKMGLLSPRRESSVGPDRGSELNNNSSQQDHNLCHLDNLIQDQCNILTRAVENILAVSSEDIFHSKVSEKKVSSDSKENFQTGQESLLLVEDVDFKEALDRFSEETLSMSTENILWSTVKNNSKSKPRKYLERSFNTFPIINEGRSPILYLILI